MCLYAYRNPMCHDINNPICLQWEQQLPLHAANWMLAWAVTEGSEAAISRANNYFIDMNYRLPEQSHIDLDKHSETMCDLCKWFYDGPCSSNKIVVDHMYIHPRCRDSKWCIDNFPIGEDLKASEETRAKLPDWIQIKKEDASLFCIEQRSCRMCSWTLEDISRVKDWFGEPIFDDDIIAFEDTKEIMQWAEHHLLAGLHIVCSSDF